MLSNGLICLQDALWKRIHPRNCLHRFCPEDGGARNTAHAIIYFFTSIPFSSFPSPTPAPFPPYHQSRKHHAPLSLLLPRKPAEQFKSDVLGAEDPYGSARVCLRTPNHYYSLDRKAVPFIKDQNTDVSAQEGKHCCQGPGNLLPFQLFSGTLGHLLPELSHFPYTSDPGWVQSVNRCKKTVTNAKITTNI